MSFKNIADYSSKDLEYGYSTKDVLDRLYDESIDRKSQLEMRRTFIFDDGIDLSRLVKDHQWYVDSLKHPKEPRRQLRTLGSPQSPSQPLRGS